MKTILSVALEELHQQEEQELQAAPTKLEDFQETVEIAERTAEFTEYSNQYQNLTDTQQVLENIQELIQNSDYPEDKVNYQAITTITNELVINAGLDPESDLLVANESWGNEETPRGTQRAIALEAIGKVIAGILEAIKRFVERIYVWLKQLWTWIKNRVGGLTKKAAVLQEEVKTEGSRKKAFTAELSKANQKFQEDNPGKKPALKDLIELTSVSEIIDQGQSTKPATKAKYHRKRVRSFKDMRLVSPTDEPISEATSRLSNTLSIEDYAGPDVVDSIFSFLQTVEGMEICYKSPKGRYLLSSKQVEDFKTKKTYGQIKDVEKTLSNTISIARSFLAYAKKDYIGQLKAAVQLLLATNFDQDKAGAILKEAIPQSKDLKNIFNNGKVIGNELSIGSDELAFYSSISMTAPEDISAVIEDAFGARVSTHIAQMKFFATPGASVTPLIELTPQKTTKSITTIMDRQVRELFQVFNDTSDFALRYGAIMDGLGKALERVSRGADNEDSVARISFARLMLHVANTYINQPLVVFNNLLSNSIDAALDYSDSYLVCVDPVAALTAWKKVKDE